MAIKTGSYDLSDRVLISMARKHLEESLAILRRSQDSDRLSSHISSIRKVKSNLEILYQEILVEKSA